MATRTSYVPPWGKKEKIHNHTKNGKTRPCQDKIKQDDVLAELLQVYKLCKSQDFLEPPAFLILHMKKEAQIFICDRWNRKPKHTAWNHHLVGWVIRKETSEFSSFLKNVPPMTSFGSNISGLNVAQLTRQLQPQPSFFLLIYNLTFFKKKLLAPSLFCCLWKSILPFSSSLSNIFALPSLASWPPRCKMPEAGIISLGQCPVV